MRRNLMKIYTKTGDKGSSQLYSGQRVSKTNNVFTALGDTDELNAALGVVHCTVNDEDLSKQLVEIQSRLLDIGSCIATPLSSSSSAKKSRVSFNDGHVDLLERWIDGHEEKLPSLKNFILPGGGISSCQYHVARSICRRAERSVVALEDECDDVVKRYLNRLGDYLFVAARTIAKRQDNTETIYKKSNE